MIVLLRNVIGDNENRNSEDSPRYSVYFKKCTRSQCAAVTRGCDFTIITLPVPDKLDTEAQSVEILVETELDTPIVALEWDVSELCVVVGDDSGSLHLFTRAGQLLFSKKIVPVVGN